MPWPLATPLVYQRLLRWFAVKQTGFVFVFFPFSVSSLTSCLPLLKILSFACFELLLLFVETYLRGVAFLHADAVAATDLTGFSTSVDASLESKVFCVRCVFCVSCGPCIAGCQILLPLDLANEKEPVHESICSIFCAVRCSARRVYQDSLTHAQEGRSATVLCKNH